MARFGHKFRAKPVIEDGKRFASTLEWKYFKHLQLLQSIGDIVFFLEQVPFKLPGGTKYVCDFQVFKADGSVSFVDVKGMVTPTFTLKRKMVEEIYPIQIEIIKQGDF